MQVRKAESNSDQPESVDWDGKSYELPAKTLVHCSTEEARKRITFQTATKLCVLPLGSISTPTGEGIVVAASESTIEVSRAIKWEVGCDVKIIKVTRDQLTTAIFEAYTKDGTELSRSIISLPESANTAEATEDSPNIRIAISESSRFLNTLLDYSLSVHASDIHIVPRSKGFEVRLRIQGELRGLESSKFSREIHETLVRRIKVLANLDSTVKATPQDGAFRMECAAGKVNVRVSCMPTLHGQKIVLRILRESVVINIDELGMDPEVETRICEISDKREGAIILCGATGSGKTTTTYAILNRLAKNGLNVATIEDPVEILLDSLSQTTIDDSIGLTYPVALRSVLRQDPDAIMLGEIRDEESAKMAFNAALTGHFLVSTVHAGNASEALLRLLTLGVDQFTLSQGLSMVIYQKLLPRLCDSCKVMDLHQTNRFGFETFRQVGCRRCDYSGLYGRVLATEVLSLNVSPLPGESPQEWMGRLLHASDGFVSIEKSLISLLRAGQISGKDVTGFIKSSISTECMHVGLQQR